MSLPHGFPERYAAALESQLSDEGEAALHQAYQLGRLALSEGISVLDIALLHHDALSRFMLDDVVDDERERLARAAEFLAECLSPFEMTLQGYREANLRLTTMNDRLEKANEETRAAHEKLTAEVAERRRVEEALWQAQKHQAVGRLAGGIAHHFNNLLTVALGNLDMAKREAGADPLDRMLTVALHAVERGAKLTRQLLSFSRQQMLKPEIVELSQRLPEMATLLGGAVRADIAVETDFADDLWPAMVDRAELELAILNLAINARDAMERGGTIRVSAANRRIRDERLGLNGDYVEIEVADDGAGIPAEILSRVFDPFFTTKDIDKGSGLGLSQVHGFAHQSGGAVDIESVEGKGTTVRLYLPAVNAEPAAADAAPEAHNAMGTVLVVEDDLDIAEIAAQGLQQCGFHVKLAHRARAALDLLRGGQRVDVLFSDVLMPGGMSGLDLADEVRSRFPQIQVLLATGYNEALATAASKGVRIIAKPYRVKELCAEVSRLLGQHMA